MHHLHQNRSWPAARNMFMAAELRRCSAALEAAGIEHIVLKGAPLAERLFGSVARRQHPQMDNDLLIRPEALPNAVEVLAEQGYAPKDPRPLPSKMHLEFQFALRATRVSGPALVELHWNAFDPILFSVNANALWEHSVWIDAVGARFRVFDPPLTLVHLAYHYTYNFRSPWALDDFAAAWKLWATEYADETIALARKLGLTDQVRLAAFFASKAGILPVGGPLASGAPLRRAKLLSAFGYGPTHEIKRSLFRALTPVLLLRPRRVPLWLAYRLAPPIEVMAAIYHRPVSPLLYARYLTRLGRPLRRRMLGSWPDRRK